MINHERITGQTEPYGEISPKEYFDAWDAETEEKERLHPGFHDRWYEYLMTRYPGPGMDADAFFDSE
jgi:hypothetical protein